MPYLILIIGLLVSALAIYMWFLNTETRQVKHAIRAVALTFYALVLLFFAVTGRIIISIVLLVVAFPFLLAYIREKNAPIKEEKDAPPDVKILKENEVEILEDEKSEEKDNE